MRRKLKVVMRRNKFNDATLGMLSNELGFVMLFTFRLIVEQDFLSSCCVVFFIELGKKMRKKIWKSLSSWAEASTLLT